MAVRKRKSNRKRTNAGRFVKKAANPRRRRRRRNTVVARRRNRRPMLAANPRRRRRRSFGRRRNPSGIAIGQIVKNAIYGAGGAILTRVGSTVLEGFVPGSFAGQPYTRPIVQAAVAVFGVRWIGKRFLSPGQADTMMLGGLISAGLAAADAYLPNIQGQLTSIIRAPVLVAPTAPANGATAGMGYGLGDVYDLPASAFAGLGDVEDVPQGIWS